MKRHALAFQTRDFLLRALLRRILLRSASEDALRIRCGDLEDAVQVQAAIHHKKITAIITRDVKGFRRSSMPAFNYREAIAMIEAG